jgi:spermidine synthase
MINRYYSLDFLEILKTRVTANAVVSMSLPSSADYVSPLAAKTNSTLFVTMKAVFRNVLILPGQKNYFLASDSSLSPGISSLASRSGISNKYVNPYYLDESSMKERRAYILSQLDTTGTVNRDFRPVAFFQQIQYWSSMFKSNWLIAGSLVLLLLIFLCFSLDRISLGLFTGGMTAASVEIMIMIAFQVIYGYVFLMSGIIITLFMAGLALGAFSSGKLFPAPTTGKFISIQLTMGLYTLGFPFLILAMNLPGISSLFTGFVFVLMTLLISFITGLEFSVASAFYREDVTSGISRNYSADMFGSALGAMVTTLILLPLTGLVVTSLILFFLNLFSAGILTNTVNG